MNRLLLLIALISLHCNSPRPPAIGTKFFTYDAVTHYTTEFDAGNVPYFMKDLKTPQDSLRADILLGLVPRDSSEYSVMQQLESAGFGRKNIDPQKFAALDSIFAEQKVEQCNETTCIPIYRDVLVFQQKGRTVGVAKICFECGKEMITGTKANTDCFGVNGGYERLKQILEE